MPPPSEELFLNARELPADQRTAWLARACEGDEELQQAVAALLALEEQADAHAFLTGFGDEAAAPAPAREHVGPYRIERELGRGAQATVYLAHDPALDRPVALKVLRNVLPDGVSRLAQRFRREATAMAALDHPGLCAVYDTGVDDGVAWIAMRYVEGRSLAEMLAERPGALALTATAETSTNGSDVESSTRSPQLRAVALFERVARALHVAHETGLVHRDVKPGNLMVTGDGQPVLLDFGIAMLTESDPGGTLTRTTDQLGTPAYMAPEQLRGAPDRVDRRADVYALGVTLYEALSGERPFAAVSREQLYRQVLAEEPRPLRAVAPDVPRDLEVVVATAIDKDRDRRYATALDLAEDLRRVRQHEPIAAKPISRLGRLWRWSRRNPAIALSASAAFASLAAGLVISLLLVERLESTVATTRAIGLANAANSEMLDDPTTALLLGLEAIQNEDRLETRSALHRAMALAHEAALFEPGAAVLYADALADGSRIVTAAANGRLQCWAPDGTEVWRYQHTSESDAPSHGAACMVAAFVGPDRDRVLGAFRDGSLRVFDRDGGLLTTVPAEAGMRVDFSGRIPRDPGDRSQLLIGFEDSVRLFALGGADRAQLRELQRFPKADLDGRWACSPDWRWIAVAPRGSAVGDLWRLVGGEDRGTRYERFGPIAATPQRTVDLAFAGDRLLVGDDDGRGTLYDIASGERFPFPGRVRNARVLGDGRIVTTNLGGWPRVWSSDPSGWGDEERRGDSRHGLTEAPAIVSTDGRSFATLYQDGTALVHDLRDVEPPRRQHRVRTTLLRHRGLPTNALFVDGDRRLLSWSSAARLWDLTTDATWANVGGELRFSPDPEGRLLLTQNQVWNAQREPQFSVERGGRWSKGLRFSSDGSRIGFRHGNTLKVYDTATGELVARHVDDDIMGPVCMLAGGTEMLRIDRDAVPAASLIWNYETNEVRPGPMLPGKAIAATCSPDGDRIVVSVRPSLVCQFRQVDGGFERVTQQVGDFARTLSFSPDGEQLLIGTDDGRIAAFDKALQPLPAAFVGHRQRLVDIRHSRDGKMVVSTSVDHTARLWTRDGEPIAVLAGNELNFIGCEFTPDGRHVLTSHPGCIRTWPIDTKDLIEAARARAKRALLPAERAKYADLLGTK